MMNKAMKHLYIVKMYVLKQQENQPIACSNFRTINTWELEEHKYDYVIGNVKTTSVLIVSCFHFYLVYA